MMKRICVILISLISAAAYAQKQTQPAMPEIPLTPEAAAFAKYGDTPVNYSTGAVNFQVPIYELSLKNYSVPISLNYQGSGFRVDEMASDVGLGWTLQGFGVISQSIRGLRDRFDGSSGYDTKEEIIALVDADNMTENGLDYLVCEEGACGRSTLSSTNQLPVNQDNIFFGGKDGEPDLFHFNFPGYSGKFYIDKNGDFITLEASRLEIEWIPGEERFQIIDEAGVIYSFEDKEVITTENTCNGATYRDIDRKIDNYSPNYYLTSITLPQGGVIEYGYDDYSYVYYNGISQTDYHKRSVNGFTKGISTCYNEVTITTGKKLAQISTDQGLVVDFTYNEIQRSDLPSAANDLTISGSLDNIKISHNGKFINEYTLRHDYTSGLADINGGVRNFTAISGVALASSYRRLMLTEVEESGKNPYMFKYNSDAEFGAKVLPSTYSFAKDFWGYYNGQHDNPNLVPQFIVEGFVIGDADRSVTSDLVAANMLKKIIYPTGGYTLFNYQPHQKDVILPSDDNGCTESIETRSVTLISIGDQGPQTALIEIKPQSFDIVANYATNIPAVDNSRTEQFIPEEGEPFSQCLIWNQQNFIGPSFNRAISLPVGTHELRLWTAGEVGGNGQPINPVRTSVTISWKEPVTSCTFNTKRLFYGGVRLAGKIDVPQEDHEVEEAVYRSYRYFWPSTNNDIYNPDDAYEPTSAYHRTNTYIPEYNGGLSNVKCDFWGSYFGENGDAYIHHTSMGSESQYNLGYSNGTVMIYGRVDEMYGSRRAPGTLIEVGEDDDLTGRTDILGMRRYIFQNYENTKRGVTGIYSEDDYSWLNGTLSSTQDYKFIPGSGSFELVREVKNHYTLHAPRFGRSPLNHHEIWSLKVSRTYAPFLLVIKVDDCSKVAPRYSHAFYKMEAIWQTLDRVEEFIYDGVDIKRETINYHNSDNLQLSKTVQEIDDYTALTNYYWYPTDLANQGGIYSELFQRNILNTPIYTAQTIRSARPSLTPGLSTEVEKYVNINKLNYSLSGNDVRPVSITSSEISGLEEVDTFVELTELETVLGKGSNVTQLMYNDFGNVVEVIKNEQSQTYVWDEDNLNLIAQVVNASHNQVFYESFESTGTTGDSKTGEQYLNSGTYTIPQPMSGDNLKMSYWYWAGGKWEFSGELDFIPTINSSGSRLDEVRVYPQYALMTTYSHKTGVGVTSISDPNGITTYYDYDDANRLKIILDHDSNALQLYDYNYAPQD